MEWQHLVYFQTVARFQHMTRAAESLSISQPALSRSISRLEEELGVPLFERQGRSIILNRYGSLFLKRVDNILTEFQEGKQEIQDLLHPESGEVSLGFLHTLGTHLIPDLIGTFRESHPNVKFQLTQNNSGVLLEKLEAGEIDLCLVSANESNVRVQWEKLWSEELLAIVPAGHPLGKSKTILLSELKGDSFILLKKGYGLRKVTDDLLAEAGIVPRVTFEGEEVTTVAGLVAEGLGVSLIPDIKGLDSSKVCKIPVHWPTCERVIGMAWLEGKYLSPATIQFKQFVTDYFNKL
ncbi:LysR family transcriptional regulator [Bacillus sp. ISL-47]|uniref:LysR family transcriptional regulator n=1 Tax=Bacillus sp. ISL-47 TaxID=2819130 RepID=UPI001BE8D490|nr:LysR family transcriptional regulator [Bacillus sp. ISL-47]MBT2710840.1 LysR family transcriptional regulator [Pseudomonas sp. ISL-84]